MSDLSQQYDVTVVPYFCFLEVREVYQCVTFWNLRLVLKRNGVFQNSGVFATVEGAEAAEVSNFTRSLAGGSKNSAHLQSSERCERPRDVVGHIQKLISSKPVFLFMKV